MGNSLVVRDTCLMDMGDLYDIFDWEICVIFPLGESILKARMFQSRILELSIVYITCLAKKLAFRVVTVVLTWCLLSSISVVSPQIFMLRVKNCSRKNKDLSVGWWSWEYLYVQTPLTIHIWTYFENKICVNYILFELNYVSCLTNVISDTG